MRIGVISAALLASISLVVAWSEEQIPYDIVEVESLRAAPERYWLQPIMFRDELTSYPARRRMNIGGASYYLFSTRELETCAAEEAAADRLRDLKLKQEYYFKGTVLARGREFYVVVSEVAPALDTGEVAAEVQREVEHPAEQALQQLLDRVEAALMALAEERGVSLGQLLRPESEYQGLVLDTIQSTILKESRLSGTTAEMLLSHLVLRAMGKRVGSRAAGIGPASIPGTRVERAALPAAATRLRAGVIRIRPHKESSSLVDKPGEAQQPETSSVVVPP